MRVCVLLYDKCQCLSSLKHACGRPYACELLSKLGLRNVMNDPMNPLEIPSFAFSHTAIGSRFVTSGCIIYALSFYELQARGTVTARPQSFSLFFSAIPSKTSAFSLSLLVCHPFLKKIVCSGCCCIFIYLFSYFFIVFIAVYFVLLATRR